MSETDLNNLKSDFVANVNLWEVLKACDVLNCETMMQDWDFMLRELGGIDAFYRSSEWLQHLEEVDKGDERFVAILKDLKGCIVGLVPLLLARYKLKYAVAGRPFLSVDLRTVFILGSEPMLPGGADQYHSLLRAIDEAIPEVDAIYCDSVGMETGWCRFLSRELRLSREWLPAVVDGPFSQHVVKLMGTFSEYLASRSSNTRQAFKKNMSKLRKKGNGHLKIEITEIENDVPEFLRQAEAISRKTWQSGKMGTRIINNDESRKNLCNLAVRGLLRSYILRCGDVPCAFLHGYQGNNVYYGAETGYDQAYANLSPGAVLFYMVFEDLHARKSPEFMNFGVGDAWYKTRFANIQIEGSSFLLLRNTAVNRIIANSYGMFRRSISLTKRARQCFNSFLRTYVARK